MFLWTRIKQHFRKRVLFGLLVVAPFGLTLFILTKIVMFGMNVLSRPVTTGLRSILKTVSPALLEQLYPSGAPVWWVELPALIVSVIFTLILIYIVGLLSATLFGRRYIAAGESLLKRIPGALFCYNTIKQVTEIISMPRSRAFQKVVVIEYPRQGVWAFAFFTGLTREATSNEVMVNVFVPTTPNPTSGFLLLLPVREVRETNLSVSDATRFIISGGVVSLTKLKLRPFPVEEYLSESRSGEIVAAPQPDGKETASS